MLLRMLFVIVVVIAAIVVYGGRHKPPSAPSVDVLQQSDICGKDFERFIDPKFVLCWAVSEKKGYSVTVPCTTIAKCYAERTWP